MKCNVCVCDTFDIFAFLLSYIFIDIEKNRPQRKAYSRLNQNVDDIGDETKKNELLENRIVEHLFENEKKNEKINKITTSEHNKDENGNEFGNQVEQININATLHFNENKFPSNNCNIEPMTISDDDEDYGMYLKNTLQKMREHNPRKIYSFNILDETNYCTVCDRSFLTNQHLKIHQQKKKHFG